MAGPTLAQYISRKRLVPPSAKSQPWLADGNILLLLQHHAFRFHKHLLTSQSKEFAKKVEKMGDGATDVLEGAAVLELPPWVHQKDLSAFLVAVLEEPESFPLDTLDDFMRLAGVLRLSTHFDAPILRDTTLTALRARYPTTLAGWDLVRPPSPSTPRLYNAPWEHDRALVINLAREVRAVDILPSAMAMLANDCSAGEVFGVRLPDSPFSNPFTPPPSAFPASPTSPTSLFQNQIEQGQLTPLNPYDAPAFALMKEHSHHCSISLLLAIRSLAQSCTRPPQKLPSVVGRAPVGSKTLLPGPSKCLAFFKEVASNLLEQLVLVSPVGYPDFVPRVLAVQPEPTRVCKVCSKAFGACVREGRERWWEGLPRAGGWEGWEAVRGPRDGAWVEY
ncbi:hypothetical protein DXG01_005342 [Tephrocybe rancida]|nr:hypothetical protein DXG01_005342 [Tephrocybe rancida]